MKNLKLILPMLAFVFAVEMSFTTVNATVDTEAWIDLGDGTPFKINTIPCVGTGNECQVIVESLPNPGPYTLHKDSRLNNPYESNTSTPHTITD